MQNSILAALMSKDSQEATLGSVAVVQLIVWQEWSGNHAANHHHNVSSCVVRLRATGKRG